MSVKDEVLHMLEANKGRYFSGATLAKELNVSRNSIWKKMKGTRFWLLQIKVIVLNNQMIF